MTFDKCSIKGKLYGYVIDEAGNEVSDPEVESHDELGRTRVCCVVEIESDRVRREGRRLSMVRLEINRRDQEGRQGCRSFLHPARSLPYGHARREGRQDYLSSSIAR